VISRKLLINTLCEFGPIIAFIVLFETSDFMAGVIAMMIANVISLFVLLHFEKHIPIRLGAYFWWYYTFCRYP
jgi:intracellular septation protein A